MGGRLAVGADDRNGIVIAVLGIDVAAGVTVGIYGVACKIALELSLGVNDAAVGLASGCITKIDVSITVLEAAGMVY